MVVVAALRAAAADVLRSNLYELYRYGPRSLGGWEGARDEVVCTELRGTTTDVWRRNPLDCDDEIQTDFQNKFASTAAACRLLGLAFVLVWVGRLVVSALPRAAVWCAMRVCALRRSGHDTGGQAVVLGVDHRRRSRRRRRLRAFRGRRDAAPHSTRVKDAFMLAPRLPGLSSLSSSPGASTPGSTWAWSPLPDPSTPHRPQRVLAPRTSRTTWPGTPARTGMTSDASM